MQLQSKTLEAEINVGAAFLQKKLSVDSSLESVTREMMQFKEAFPNLYALYAAALTFGISTASCENSFSALTRILQPRRRSMTHERKAQLVLLAFEKALTRQINMDSFLDKFRSSSRRIHV